MRICLRTLAISTCAGIVITLLSALILNDNVIGEFPDIRFVSIPMLGVSYWGYPLPWLKQVVYPGAAMEPIWSHLLIDMLYWGGVVFIVEVYYLKDLKIKERIAGRLTLKLPGHKRNHKRTKAKTRQRRSVRKASRRRKPARKPRRHSRRR